MNIKAVLLEQCICESVCIQWVLGGGTGVQVLDLDIHFQEDGIAMLWSKLCMEQVGGDGNNSALELRKGVFHTFSAWMEGCSLV